MNDTPSPTPANQSGCLDYGLYVATAAWIILVTVVLHAGGWTVDQVLLITGLPLPWYAWLFVTWGQALLLGVPVFLLSLRTGAPRLQAAYRVWVLAILALVPLGMVRLLPPAWNQPAALAQIVIGLGMFAVAVGLARSRGRRPASSGSGLLLALALTPVVVLPWLLFGALGSPADSVLNLLAGLSLGLFAGVLISTLLMRPLAEHSTGTGRDLAFGGFTVGIVLLILASGFGFNGSQLLLGLSLPPLGFAVAGLSLFAGAEGPGGTRDRGWLPVAVLTGLAAAAALMFVDPEELTLILGSNEIYDWALRAAVLSFLIGWGIGLAMMLLSRRLVPKALPAGAGADTPAVGAPAGSLRGALIAGLILTWLAGGVMYFMVGQPGFYGDELFVVLRDQADLSAASAMPDRAERLSYVYDTLTEHANTSQAGLRATLDRLNLDYTPYYLINGIEVNAGPLLRLYLESQPEVDRVLDSPHLRPLPAPLPVEGGDLGPPDVPQWNITSIGADRVWQEFGATGEGIIVGQSDSGVQGDHPALRDGYRGRAGGDDYNWLDPWNGTRSPADVGGHGTHTLGSVLGRGGIGVAPGAEWFGCVNLARNLGNPALYLTCMQFMLAPYPQGGDPLADGDPTRAAHVLNNSWGCPPLEGCDALALAPGVSALRAAGIFVVASAGNEGPYCSSVSDPIAIYDDAFSVGAIDESGFIAQFSSRGPVDEDGSNRLKPDIVAPGVEIWSSLPNSTYGTNSGTSMAGPHIAGVVALLWSAQPDLIGDIDRTEQILIQTAQPVDIFDDPCGSTEIPNNVAGYGEVDAYEAVKLALGK